MRRILIGKNAKIWKALAADASVRSRFSHVIGHADAQGFNFEAEDEIWLLSYSRSQSDNKAMLDLLQQAGIGRLVYFSSATTNIAGVTDCYEYPRVKALAADYAKSRLGAVIVLLGLVYERAGDLPSGTTAGISLEDLGSFFRSFNPDAAREIRLFSMTEKPFMSGFEKFLHRAYDAAQSRSGRWPCLLRPVDYLLRAAGYKWYGYINLSNRLWISTIS